MRHPHRISIIKFLVVITALMILNINSFSWWWYNNSGSAYEEGDGTFGTSISRIDQYIVEGAGYFLDSYATTLTFMREIEISVNRELDYPELSQLVDSALTRVEQARATYKLLKETADNTPYNPMVLEALKNFNYDLFRETNRLNNDIFIEVKGYLIKGQVRELYGKILSDLENISTLLQTVKKSIEMNLFPPVSTVWQLNQAYSTSLLFGQYTAMIFNSL